MMINTVKKYIESEQLLRPEARVLVALSGGADSVALLCILHNLGYACEAAHCNFHLRAEESDRDEDFVRNLCCRLQVPLHVAHFQTEQYARSRKMSIEMAARTQRYQWFEELRCRLGAEAVAVAHHRDDSVETFFINLLRGTGIDGLCGIRPRRDHIVRPLLCVSRADILGFLQHEGQAYVTDSTNLEDHYKRNKVRLHVMPQLECIQPQAAQRIAATEDLLRQVAGYYHEAIQEEMNAVCTGNRIDIPRLLQTRRPKLTLYELLSPFGFQPAQIDDVFQALAGQSGREFYASRCRLLKDRDALLIQTMECGNAANDTRQLVLYAGENTLPDGCVLDVEFVEADGYAVKLDRSVACVDADSLSMPLLVRHPQPGDWFIPFGMKGRKLLSDFFTDLKYSRIDKENAWVVCSDDAVVWVVGERPDNRFRIGASTRRVCQLMLR